MTILLLALIPLIILIIAHFMYPKDITLPELAVGALVSVVLAFGLYSAGKHSQLYDTELWNGEITGKSRSIVEYSRPYDCMCSTDNDGNRSCSTCYDTGSDMYWDADSTIGDFRIRHIDCSSTVESRCIARHPDPQRWLDIRTGDPVSRTNRYLNYVKAANQGLFHQDGVVDDGPQSRVPDLKYPIQVYDFYHVDRVLLDGVTLPEDINVWNRGLAEILKTLGPERQANMVVVLTDAGNPSYGDLLMDQWKGANKNDIVIIAGFTSGTTTTAPDWVAVHSWAQQDYMNVLMRDELLDHADWWSSAETFFPNVQSIVMEHFVRRSMKEFEYLADEIEPSTSMIVLLSIIGVIAGLGLAVLFAAVDVFGTRSTAISRDRRY